MADQSEDLPPLALYAGALVIAEPEESEAVNTQVPVQDIVESAKAAKSNPSVVRVDMAKLLAEADPDQKSQEHMSAHFSRVAEQMASEKKQKASEGSQWVPTAYVYSSLLHAQLEEDRIEMQRNEKKRREEKLAQTESEIQEIQEKIDEQSRSVEEKRAGLDKLQQEGEEVDRAKKQEAEDEHASAQQRLGELHQEKQEKDKLYQSFVSNLQAPFSHRIVYIISGLESKFDSKTLEQDRIEDRLSYITSMGGLDESLLRGILTISVHNESKDEHGQGHLETVLDGKQLKMVQGLFSQSEMMTTSGDYKAGSRNVAVVDIPYTIPFSEESKDEKKDTKKSGGKGGSQAAKSASQGTKSKGKDGKEAKGEAAFSDDTPVVKNFLEKTGEYIDALHKYLSWLSSAHVEQVPALESDEHGIPQVDTSHYESLLGQVDFEQQTVPVLLHCMVGQVGRNLVEREISEAAAAKDRSATVSRHIHQAFQDVSGAGNWSPVKGRGVSKGNHQIAGENDEAGQRHLLSRTLWHKPFNPLDVERRMLYRVPRFLEDTSERDESKQEVAKTKHLALRSHAAPEEGCSSRQLERFKLLSEVESILPNLVQETHGDSIVQRHFEEGIEAYEFAQIYSKAHLDYPQKSSSYSAFEDALLVAFYASADDISEPLNIARAKPFRDYYDDYDPHHEEPEMVYAVEAHAGCHRHGFYCYPADNSIIEIEGPQSLKGTFRSGATLSLRHAPSAKDSASGGPTQDRQDEKHDPDSQLQLTFHDGSLSAAFVRDEKSRIQHVDARGLLVECVSDGHVYQKKAVASSSTFYCDESRGLWNREAWRCVTPEGCVIRRLEDNSTEILTPEGRIAQRPSGGGYWIRTETDGRRWKQNDAHWHYPQPQPKEDEQKEEKPAKGGTQKQTKGSKDTKSVSKGGGEAQEEEQPQPEPEWIVPEPYSLDSLQVSRNTDLESNSKVITRSDLTMIVENHDDVGRIVFYKDGTRIITSKGNWRVEAEDYAPVQGNEEGTILCDIGNATGKTSDGCIEFKYQDGSAICMKEGTAAFCPGQQKKPEEIARRSVDSLAGCESAEVWMTLQAEPGTYAALLPAGAFKTFDKNGDGFEMNADGHLRSFGSLAEAAMSRTLTRDALERVSRKVELENSEKEQSAEEHDEYAESHQRNARSNLSEPDVSIVAPSIYPRVFIFYRSGHALELIDDRVAQRYLEMIKEAEDTTVWNEPSGDEGELITVFRRKQPPAPRVPGKLPYLPKVQPRPPSPMRAMPSMPLPSQPVKPSLPVEVYLPRNVVGEDQSPTATISQFYCVRQLLKYEPPKKDVAERCLGVFQEWEASQQNRSTDSLYSADSRTEEERANYQELSKQALSLRASRVRSFRKSLREASEGDTSQQVEANSEEDHLTRTSPACHSRQNSFAQAGPFALPFRASQRA